MVETDQFKCNKGNKTEKKRQQQKKRTCEKKRSERRNSFQFAFFSSVRVFFSISISDSMYHLRISNEKVDPEKKSLCNTIKVRDGTKKKTKKKEYVENFKS